VDDVVAAFDAVMAAVRWVAALEAVGVHICSCTTLRDRPPFRSPNGKRCFVPFSFPVNYPDKSCYWFGCPAPAASFGPASAADSSA
jgi:hypothetical protein